MPTPSIPAHTKPRRKQAKKQETQAPPPPVAHRWAPGQSGNPKGRPKLPEHLRAIKELTPDECKRTFSRFARMTETECFELASSDGATVLERAIANGMIACVHKPDVSWLNFVLDRAGAAMPKDGGAVGGMIVNNINFAELSNEELTLLARQALQVVEVESKLILPEGE